MEDERNIYHVRDRFEEKNTSTLTEVVSLLPSDTSVYNQSKMGRYSGLHWVQHIE